MSMFSQFLLPEAAYSLHRTEFSFAFHILFIKIIPINVFPILRIYNHERRTGELGITYYVKPDFIKQFSGSIHRIDQQIEENYVQQLRTNCFRERSHSKLN